MPKESSPCRNARRHEARPRPKPRPKMLKTMTNAWLYQSFHAVWHGIGTGLDLWCEQRAVIVRLVFDSWRLYSYVYLTIWQLSLTALWIVNCEFIRSPDICNICEGREASSLRLHENAARIEIHPTSWSDLLSYSIFSSISLHIYNPGSTTSDRSLPPIKLSNQAI